MTTRLNMAITDEPQIDLHFNSYLQLEIEDGAEDELREFFQSYLRSKGLEDDEFYELAEDVPLAELLSELRSLPFVLSAEKAKFFYPLNS